MGHQIVFVCNAALLGEICDQTRFRKCVTGPVVEIRYSVHDSLFSAYDNEPSWGIAHRIMAPLLTGTSVESLFDDMRSCTSDSITKWTSNSNQRVLVTNDLDRMGLISVTQCFFHQRIHALEGPEPPMIKAMDGATLEAMKRPTRPGFINTLFFQRRFERDTKTMRKYAAAVVAKRKAEPTDRKDMLFALLEGKDPQTGESLNYERVIDEIVTIYIGASTAPNLVSFALYYLMKNPEEITKAREEIDRIVGGPDVPIQLSHLSHLPYCEAILRETLRLGAPAPGFNIEPIPDSPDVVTLAAGEYQIPKNQVMITILSAVNRDPAVFPDEPEAFRPARMVGEKYNQLPDAVKKGFGNGKRRCIGAEYAWQWSFLMLVTTLQKADFTLVDKNYNLHINGAFNVKPLNLYAHVGPRK